MLDRCRDDRKKEMKTMSAKFLEMSQNLHEKVKTESERIEKLDEKIRKEQSAKLLEKESICSTLLMSGPRITWRVDDPDIQGSDGFSKSAESYLETMQKIMQER